MPYVWQDPVPVPADSRGMLVNEDVVNGDSVDVGTVDVEGGGTVVVGATKIADGGSVIVGEAEIVGEVEKAVAEAVESEELLDIVLAILAQGSPTRENPVVIVIHASLCSS